MPRVELDASEIRDPREASGVGHHREVRLVPGWVADVDRFEPVRMRIGNALLIEEVAIDAVRVPLHLHRASGHVVQHGVSDVDVVADEVALGESGFREEHLLDVGDLDLAAGDDERLGCLRHERYTKLRYRGM